MASIKQIQLNGIDYNLVDALFGTMSWFSRTIYTLVGIAAIYAIAFYDREGQRAQFKC